VDIASNKVVTLEYELKDDQGAVIDRADSSAPLTYLHGAHNLVPGLESALDGKSVGETIEVTVPTDQGYGERSDALVRNIAVRKLPKGKGQVGMRFRVDTEGGPMVFSVTALKGDYATVDANHPLAGMTLHFKVSVLAVRDATEEEVAHGHAHDAHGGHGHE
jgi:FKBP-type peptidyl-prolyl cis-trans isomerase SlyD